MDDGVKISKSNIRPIVLEKVDLHRKSSFILSAAEVSPYKHCGLGIV